MSFALNEISGTHHWGVAADYLHRSFDFKSDELLGNFRGLSEVVFASDFADTLGNLLRASR